MTVIETNLGWSVADGEGVEVHTERGDLVLRFVDWREHPVEHVFVDTLGFRWAGRPSVEVPRDDMSYEVVGSAWLANEAADEPCPAEELVHYVLCFNACGVLEVVCRRPR
jgi:hypothetical protein